MALAETLTRSHEAVLHEATGALGRAHLRHYDTGGPGEVRDALDDLLAHVVECVAGRTLVPIVEYGARVANRRFDGGFDIAEVQVAFNVLEEAVWHVVVPELPADELAEALATIGAVFGAGKDALTRAWVSLLAPEDEGAPSERLGAGPRH